MSIELGREIDSIGSRQSGNGNSGGSRRSQHQEKLKALIAALKSGNLPDARACYQDLVDFNPALSDSYFQRVGLALVSGNLSGAQRVIEEIYGQNQMIFAKPVSSMPVPAPRHSTRDDFGVLVDLSA
jgi:hypothetical protein